MPNTSLESRLKAQARYLGFDLVGVATPDPSGHLEHYRAWIGAGLQGEMAYLARADAVERRGELRHTLQGVRSVVVVGHGYGQDDPPGVPDDPSRGVIARYARGRDYHRVVKEKLLKLAAWLEAEAPGGAHRAYVDTGPILERELGQRAGLGWFGRNTMLINPGRGSYFFLGVLLTTVALDPDPPFEADRCGSCTACLDACPTGALLGRNEQGAPVLDARLCISYLTIEHRGEIPEGLRAPMGNRVYGCDICQECCPWTVKFGPEQAVRPEYEARAWPADQDGDPPLPSLDGPNLVAFTERIIAMSGKEYRRVFAESPLARPGRKGMLRNLCVALGNYGRTSAEAAERVRPVLERAADDGSELVSAPARWGLGRIRSAPPRSPRPST
ncbi:MAG TPA: tRNA epoxyqueuosine(34) reductase QueG [Longimicrobiales bacterium]|nr:tRNA epoxyqueuosine(34) reductase QueG [Longimicrobiales bacterium]